MNAYVYPYKQQNVSSDPRDMMSESIGNHFQCQTQLDKRSIQTITTCPGNQFLKAQGMQYVWRQCPRLRKFGWILPSDTLYVSRLYYIRIMASNPLELFVPQKRVAWLTGYEGLEEYEMLCDFIFDLPLPSLKSDLQMASGSEHTCSKLQPMFCRIPLVAQ